MEYAIAFGQQSNALGRHSLALGYNATVDELDANSNPVTSGLAIGVNSGVAGANGIAIGINSDAAATNTVAIGPFADSRFDAGVAIGLRATSDGVSGVAIGKDAITDGDYGVSIGEQAYSAATEPGAIALGSGAQATNTGAVAIGEGSYASGSTAVGAGAQATAPEAAAYGKLALATGENSTALGENSGADSLNSTSVGAFSKATADGATALGANSQASFENSVAIGAGVETQRQNQFVFGTASNTYTMAGLASQTSRSAQTGDLELVTVDANGNLASDGGLLLASLQGGFDASIATLGSDVATNTTAINQNTNTLQTVQTTLAARAEQTELNTASIALLNSGVQGDGGRFIELEEEVADQSVRVAAAETAIATNSETITTVMATASQNQDRIARTEQSIYDNAAAIGLLQTDFEQLGLNLDNVSQQLALTQDRVDANTAGIAIANALSGSSWLQSNESTAFTANIGYYEGSTALAFSGAQRLNKNFSANVAIGLVPERGDIGARAGVRLGW